jgi:hypothetical protein
MFLPNKTNSYVNLLSSNHLGGRKACVKMWQESPAQFLRQVIYDLLCCVLIFRSPSCWLLTLWLPLLAITPSHSAYSYNSISATWKFSIGCVFTNGVMISIPWCYDKIESLLWARTQGCTAWHVLVSRLLVMIHYETTPMCSLHVMPSLVIFLYLIRISIYQTKSSRASSWSAKRITFEEQVTDININRLPEVVDKWLYLIVHVMTSTI